jgi:hypothetical protein
MEGGVTMASMEVVRAFEWGDPLSFHHMHHTLISDEYKAHPSMFQEWYYGAVNPSTHTKSITPNPIISNLGCITLSLIDLNLHDLL